MKTALFCIVLGIFLLGVGSTGRRLSRFATVMGHSAIGFAFGYGYATVSRRP